MQDHIIKGLWILSNVSSSFNKQKSKWKVQKSLGKLQSENCNWTGQIGKIQNCLIPFQKPQIKDSQLLLEFYSTQFQGLLERKCELNKSL